MWEKHDIAKLLFLISELGRVLGKILEELHEANAIKRNEVNKGGQPESPDRWGDEGLPF